MSESDSKLEGNDLILCLKQGSYKGATSQPKVLRELVSKDVAQYFPLPITFETASKSKEEFGLHSTPQIKW